MTTNTSKNELGSRVARRAGTKSASHKLCQTQTSGARERARKTLPSFLRGTKSNSMLTTLGD